MGNIKSQLQQSLSIGVAELQNKRNALVAELDSHVEEALNQLYMAQKEKERVLKDKDQEIDCYLKEINCAGNTLQLKIKAEPKAKFVQNYSMIVSEAEEAMDIWAPEPDFNSDWAALQLPSFPFTIAGSRSATQSMLKGNFMSMDVKERFNEHRLLPDISETLEKKTVALSPIKPTLDLKFKESGTNPSTSKTSRSGLSRNAASEATSARHDREKRKIIRQLKQQISEDFRLPLEETKEELPSKVRDLNSIVSAEVLINQNKELTSRIEKLEKTIERDSRRIQIFSNRSSIERSLIRRIFPQT